MPYFPLNNALFSLKLKKRFNLSDYCRNLTKSSWQQEYPFTSDVKISLGLFNVVLLQTGIQKGG